MRYDSCIPPVRLSKELKEKILAKAKKQKVALSDFVRFALIREVERGGEQ